MSNQPTEHTSPAPDAREAWHRLLQVSSRVLRELDRALDARDRITINEFDVLITLDNAPDRQLRMTDLANETMLSSGGMTRLAGRLEERGFLRRVPDPDDARAFRATLTPEGSQKLKQARITHDGVITQLIATHTTAANRRTLKKTLEKIIDGFAS